MSDKQTAVKAAPGPGTGTDQQQQSVTWQMLDTAPVAEQTMPGMGTAVLIGDLPVMAVKPEPGGG